MTTNELKNYIIENRPWSVEKEWELIADMGGANKKGDHYYITNTYVIVTDEIAKAFKLLERKDYAQSKAYQELAAKNPDMVN